MHLTTYLRLLLRAEEALGVSYRHIGDGHPGEADVYYTCRRFAEDAAGHAVALEPVLLRYERVAEPEPERLHPPGLTGAREGPVGLLRDLQDLYQLANLVDSTWTSGGSRCPRPGPDRPRRPVRSGGVRATGLAADADEGNGAADVARRELKRPRLVEVHLHISDAGLVTVSREPLTALADARRAVAAKPSAHQGHAVHGVLGALADSFLDALDGFDDAIDGLQESVAERPTTAGRQQIFALRRELAEMRRVLVPQRNLLAPGGHLVDAIPFLHADELRDSFRDVHDHLDRAAGLLGSYREQLAGLLDLYLAEVSTRLNEVASTVAVAIYLRRTGGD